MLISQIGGFQGDTELDSIGNTYQKITESNCESN